ncbi:hypothetical protein [Ornithinimicrobium kibberense]|uniref:hypothetical protein n=1 Tax=Ornithinimicrobium kibberense TaxID=282060 RepID=UPI0036108B51
MARLVLAVERPRSPIGRRTVPGNGERRDRATLRITRPSGHRAVSADCARAAIASWYACAPMGVSTAVVAITTDAVIRPTSHVPSGAQYRGARRRHVMRRLAGAGAADRRVDLQLVLSSHRRGRAAHRTGGAGAARTRAPCGGVDGRPW